MFTGNTFFTLVVLVVVVTVQYFLLSRLWSCFQPGPAGPGVQGGPGLPEAQRRGGDEQLGGEWRGVFCCHPVRRGIDDQVFPAGN